MQDSLLAAWRHLGSGFASRRGAGGRMRAPFALSLIAALVALLMLLPLAYLLLRAAEFGVIEALQLVLLPRNLAVMWNSALLATLVTAISLAIALPIAWLTVRTDLPWPRMWTVLTTLPLVFPSYVGAFALISMMGPRGMLQGWLEPIFGIERLPSIYGLPGATWALTCFTYPYLLLSIRAGLRNMDPALEEASRSLGDSAWRTFLRVTLPALRPAIASGSLLVALYVLSDFGAVSLMRFSSFTRVIYIQYTTSFDRRQAAVLGLVLVALTLALLIAARSVQGKRNLYSTSVGTARRMTLRPLGAFKIPALLFVIAVVMACFALPLYVILYWLVRGLINGEALLPMWWATWNTVRAGVLAAGAAALLALPVAYLSVRFPSRFASTVARVAYIGFGLPGIVVALSLVYFGANFAIVLYQTLFMLTFAYVVRFMPEALGSMRTSLFQISPRLEEAARSLGKSERQAALEVTLPLMRPGIWAGVALVFLSVAKELPATLLLSPTGFTTLATRIWAATEEVSFTRAAAPAVVLLIVSALGLIFSLRQEDGGSAV